MTRNVKALLLLVLASVAAAACSDPIPYPGPPTPSAPTPGPQTERPIMPPVPSPWTVPPPDLPEGIELTQLEMGEPTVLPPGTALLMIATCAVCDPPRQVVLRVYQRASGGDPGIEILFPRDELGLPHPVHALPDGTEMTVPPFFMGHAMTSDASVIAVGVCTRPPCEEPDLDGEMTVYRSVDGGVTWTDIAALSAGHRVVGVDGQGLAITVDRGADPPPYSTVPGGDRLRVPEGARPGSALMLSPSGEPLWIAGPGGALLRGDGRVFARIPGAETHQTSMTSQVVERGRAMALTVRRSAPAESQSLLFAFDAEGRLIDAVAGPMTHLGGWLGPDVLIGTAHHPGQGNLVIIDLDGGSVRPLPVRFKPEYGPEQVYAVVPGPLMRVTGADDCLNVRAQPGFGTPVLDCAADGVLLRDAGEERTVDGILWRRVVTPAGIEGWASAEYLER